MTLDEARALIRDRCQAGLDPVLTDGELDGLALRARRMDAQGREPTEADWTPTYDVRASVVEGWEMRAGKAAGRVTVSRGGQRVERGTLHEALLRMAAVHRRKLTGSAAMASAGSDARAAVVGEVPLANGPDEPDDALAGRPGSPLPRTRTDPWEGETA